MLCYFALHQYIVFEQTRNYLSSFASSVSLLHEMLFSPFLGSLCSRQSNCHLSGAADRSLPSLAAVAGHMSWQGVVQLRGCQVVCCEGQCPRQAVLSAV